MEEILPNLSLNVNLKELTDIMLTSKYEVDLSRIGVLFALPIMLCYSV